jgi:hypothetical protein
MLTVISNNSYERNPELYHIQGAKEKTPRLEEEIFNDPNKTEHCRLYARIC